jgi:hypothetical protein
MFDLRGDGNAMVERLQATLAPASAGDGIDLDGLWFEPNSSTISSSSGEEIRRLVRFIRGNPDKSFSIEVTLSGYLEDSLRSNPDLTEVRYDTTTVKVTHTRDSVIVALRDSLATPARDSVITLTQTRDSLLIRPRYHNDRTLRQAKAVESALIREGVPKNRLASSGKASAEAVLEKRRTLVRVIVH